MALVRSTTATSIRFAGRCYAPPSSSVLTVLVTLLSFSVLLTTFLSVVGSTGLSVINILPVFGSIENTAIEGIKSKDSDAG